MRKLVALALLLVACGSDPNAPTTTTTTYARVNIGWVGQVYEITLSDGTHCAVLDMNEAGGIDCDWASER